MAKPAKKVSAPAPVAKKTSTAVATAPRRSTAVSDPSTFESMSGVGFEDTSSQDIIIPRVSVLQPLSPQLVKSKPEFIKGASAGQIVDTGVNKVFDTVTLVPCYYARVYLEWAPRESGKGLVKNHGTDDSILNQTTHDEDTNRDVLENGNYVVETATYYCLLIDGDDVRPVFVPMASTQLKAARRWMTLLTAEKLTGTGGKRFTPPMFYRSWVGSSNEQSNAKGSWHGWRFEAGDAIMDIDPSGELLEKARNFYQQAKEGLVKGDVGSGDVEEVLNLESAEM